MIGTALHFADFQEEKIVRGTDSLSHSLSLLLAPSFHPSEASDPAHAYLTFNGRRKFSASRLLFSSISAKTDVTVTGKRDGN